MQRTLAIIKPDAVSKGFAGKILDTILQHGFLLRAIKVVHISQLQAAEFYAVHKGRPFFNDLIQFMSSGPIIPMVLEKENAVEDFRALIGATDPAEAEEGTIRKLYGTDKGKNAIHGSDSPENAETEIHFFFSELEILQSRSRA